MRMFAVVHKGFEKTASIKLMGKTKKDAILLWERWNPGTSFNESKACGEWKIVSYNIFLRDATIEDRAVQALVEYGFTRSCAIETVSGRPARADNV